MDTTGISALVTGGASGLGRASAIRLIAAGARVVILDLPSSLGAEVAADIGAIFSPGDATVPDDVNAALDLAERDGPVRALVHCAGRGATVRVVNRDGSPGDLDVYKSVIDLNLVGTFNVLRLTAARMATNEPLDGERGVCILTASIAAWEGQIGQIPYASSKGGVVSMTLVAARDLASKQIRVCSIAPGVFDTPILDRLSEELRESLGRGIPHPSRLGRPDEFGALAAHIVANPMINGETIRLDGALRMAPR